MNFSDFCSTNFLKNSQDSQKIVAIVSSLEDILQDSIFLVGGAVRDLLLGKVPKDLDLTTSLAPDLVKLKLQNAGQKCYLQGQKFGTIGTKVKDNSGKFELVEITTMRGEDYDLQTQTELRKSRKPTVNFITDLCEDLARRDLTINAMAINSQGKILDYFGGRTDLENRLIRCVGNAKLRFREDPLRILRCLRLAAKLDFEIETTTWQKIERMKWEIFRVSKERWVMEIDQILVSNPTKGLNLLMKSGLLGLIIPELILQKNYNQNSNYHDFDLWIHTLKVVQNVPENQLELRWTALLHDIAKPFVRTDNKNGKSNYVGHEILGAQMALKTCNYLKFSKSRTDFIVSNITCHLEQNSLLKPFDDAGKKIKITEIEN